MNCPAERKIRPRSSKGAWSFSFVQNNLAINSVRLDRSRRVEVIIRGVGALGFVVRLRRIAVSSWRRLAALGINSLNGGYAGEDAIS